MTDNPIIVWFRRDLRVTDNPALFEAAVTGRPVIPLYIFETDESRPWGAASRWWLHHSLTSLMSELDSLGLSLVLREGQAQTVLRELIAGTEAAAIFWNRRYSQDGRDRDAAIKTEMSDNDLLVKSFRANLLTEPWTVKTKSGGYYKVFTPYWRAAQEHIEHIEPIERPNNLTPYSGTIKSENLDAFGLRPTSPDWGQKMKPYWQPGADGAQDALARFLDGPVADYAEDRNRPDKEDGTSRLSPHLAFGEISPRQIWRACRDNDTISDTYLSEIGWREYSYVLLFHNPDLARKNFKPAFDAFPWETNPEALTRWQQGQTGYPFVDAGMRQLWQTGWQHNRVRMVTASFLIKHLLIDWREGEAWFHDTLVDADPASNAASWQWVAGSGADASPYFRIFNPFSQGEKFDPKGDYVAKYVPELAGLPPKYIHRPWDAPQSVLAAAGVKLGETYPRPIVDHKFARDRALSAYKQSRG